MRLAYAHGVERSEPEVFEGNKSGEARQRGGADGSRSSSPSTTNKIKTPLFDSLKRKDSCGQPRNEGRCRSRIGSQSGSRESPSHRRSAKSVTRVTFAYFDTSALIKRY